MINYLKKKIIILKSIHQCARKLKIISNRLFRKPNFNVCIHSRDFVSQVISSENMKIYCLSISSPKCISYSKRAINCSLLTGIHWLTVQNTIIYFIAIFFVYKLHICVFIYRSTYLLRKAIWFCTLLINDDSGWNLRLFLKCQIVYYVFL